MSDTQQAQNAERIEVFYDLGSPYSYLAMTQLDRIRQETGATVAPRAFLIGGVFKLAGNVMPASVPGKAQFMLADLQRWADDWGVPFNFSSHFAFNTLYAQRMLVAAEQQDPALAEALAHALFRYFWVDDGAVDDVAAIKAVIAGVGGDADALFAATQDPAVKEALKQVTSEAVERGAFGAPTFFWRDRLYWGNDRVDQLIQHVRAATGA